MTKVIQPREKSVLIEALKQGEVVSFPTETVYGVAVKFNDRAALDKLMEAKNRDYSKAVTLMLSHREDIGKYAEIDERVEKVAEAFMPGKITLVLKRKDSVDPAMTNNLPTIGIRIPDSPFVLDLIDKAGPLLVTSANISGGCNTTNEQEVLAQLDGRIALVVAGETHNTTASTVVNMSDGQLKILREGEISLRDIEEVLSK